LRLGRKAPIIPTTWGRRPVSRPPFEEVRHKIHSRAAAAKQTSSGEVNETVRWVGCYFCFATRSHDSRSVLWGEKKETGKVGLKMHGSELHRIPAFGVQPVVARGFWKL
jgi:hypothetical protein